ncbi:hypothetical protein V2O64_19975 [Verrucomicrobiaceae bacterium 227]
MTLNIFSGPESNAEDSKRLDSLTIAGDPESLRRLADFIASTADAIESNGPTMVHRDFRQEPGVKDSEFVLPAIYVSQCV